MRLITVLFVSLLFAGCSTSNGTYSNNNYTGEHLSIAFNNSLRSWHNLKQQHNANYSYERDTLTAEGFNTSTKITVIDDQVEYRDYFEWQQGNSPTLTWSESYAHINTHQQGVRAHTLDALYSQCKSQILSKPKARYKVILKIDTLGILQQCSYTKLACTNKCTKGIRLQGLTLK